MAASLDFRASEALATILAPLSFLLCKCRNFVHENQEDCEEWLLVWILEPMKHL